MATDNMFIVGVGHFLDLSVRLGVDCYIEEVQSDEKHFVSAFRRLVHGVFIDISHFHDVLPRRHAGFDNDIGVVARAETRFAVQRFSVGRFHQYESIGFLGDALGTGARVAVDAGTDTAALVTIGLLAFLWLRFSTESHVGVNLHSAADRFLDLNSSLDYVATFASLRILFYGSLVLTGESNSFVLCTLAGTRLMFDDLRLKGLIFGWSRHHCAEGGSSDQSDNQHGFHFRIRKRNRERKFG